MGVFVGYCVAERVILASCLHSMSIKTPLLLSVSSAYSFILTISILGQSRFQVQDKHNASYFPKCRDKIYLIKCKYTDFICDGKCLVKEF